MPVFLSMTRMNLGGMFTDFVDDTTIGGIVSMLKDRIKNQEDYHRLRENICDSPTWVTNSTVHRIGVTCFYRSSREKNPGDFSNCKHSMRMSQ